MYPSVTAIRRTVAPSVTPISLAEVKAHMRVSGADDDTVITGMIGAAVAMVDGEGTLGRAMITQTWAQWVSQSPGWVRLSMSPFQALVSVEFYDAAGALQTATLDHFETRLHGDFVICKPKEDREWPTADTRQDAIKITYRAGFGDAGTDVPDGIRHALLMIIGNFYENRESVSATSFVPVPMAVEMLLNNERVGWAG